MRQWGIIHRDISGFMRGFSESVSRMELRYPGILPDIRGGNTIFVGSDYGGQHGQSQYETYVFVLKYNFSGFNILPHA